VAELHLLELVSVMEDKPAWEVWLEELGLAIGRLVLLLPEFKLLHLT